MKLRPIKASEFIDLPSNIKNILKSHGGVPINDKVFNLIHDFSDIILLFGGRGGGKTNSIAIKLIDHIRNDDYANVYFGRKVLEDVRGTVHADIVKTIKVLGLEHEFTTLSTKPNGTLEIHHKNGNKFMPFGANDAKTIKGISDPTHIWFDEADQFLEYDFGEILPTLRTSRGHNMMLLSFNTHAVMRDHWLIKLFFTELYNGDDPVDYDIISGMKISKYFINYTDNYFIDRNAYKNFLLVSAGGDIEKFEGIANGAWGVDRTGNEFYHAFKPSVHVKKIPRLPGVPDHVTVDFNVHPYMTLIPIQVEETIHEINIRIYDEFCLPPPLNSTSAVCQRFLDTYAGQVSDIFYYGDAQGTRRIEGFGEGITRFDDLRKVFSRHITRHSDRTARSNAAVLKRQELMNKILSGNLYVKKKKVNIFVDEKCKETIKDFNEVKMGISGKLKEKVKDKEKGIKYEKNGHIGDAIEYFVSYILKAYL